MLDTLFYGWALLMVTTWSTTKLTELAMKHLSFAVLCNERAKVSSESSEMVTVGFKMADVILPFPFSTVNVPE